MRMTCAEAIVRCLGAAGVDHAFGIASGKMMPLMKAVAKQNTIKFTGVRHEAAGVMMATGVTLGTGRIACAMGELGPGGSNLIPGAANAFADNVPVILITTSLPLHVTSPSRGMLMDLDLEALFKPVTKASYRLYDGRRTAEIVYRAIREAKSGRPGPVHITVPADILGDEFTFAGAAFASDARARVASPAPDPDAIATAAHLLRTSERPLILAGGGVVQSGAGAEFAALSEALDAPATATQMGLGAIPSSHSNFIGHGGTISGEAVVHALENADVILAVGCRFSSWLWGPLGPMKAADAKVIQIDVDPATLGQMVPTEIDILSDAKAALTALVAALDGTAPAPARQAWRDTVTQKRKDWLNALRTDADAPHASDVMHPAAVTFAMDALLPPDALVTYDGGHTTFWHNDIVSAPAPRTRLHAPGLAQLGCGTGYAIGLKAAFPDRPVICTTGDGSFGFTIQELDTARRYGLPVVFVIHNNAAWGIIRAGQRKNGFEFETDLSGTDYAAIARGFGCYGHRVTALDAFRDAFATALSADLPTVIDCQTDFIGHPAMKYFGAGTENPPPDAVLPY